ncbi:phosphotransferase enzyme family protein [Pseudomonadota bacterium]
MNTGDGVLPASEFMDAAWIAVKHFPVDAIDIEPIMQSENVTFRVTDRAGGTRYVLRLHRPGYNSNEELESERVWVDALKETGVPVPASLETCQGGHFTLIDIPGVNEQRFAGMTIWLEGEPLGNFLESCTEVSERQRMLSRFGEIAAALHNQSAHWQAPPGFVRRRLGVENLLGEAPFWGRFWEHPELHEPERALLLRVRHSLRESLEIYGEKADTFSLIHADFTPDNIIYDGNQLAVIDFDDCAYGWHLYDIASLLTECTLCPDFRELQEALIDGYCLHRNLTLQDVSLLSDFLLVRAMAVIGWFYQRPEHAGSDEFHDIKNWVLDQCAAR